MQLRQINNVLAQQSHVVISMVVGLLVTRLVIQHLGGSVYANLGVMLSVIGFIGTISNAFTGAAARYITRSIARNEVEQASNYMSNTVVAVIGLGIVVGGSLVLTQLLRPGTFGNIPNGVMCLLLMAALFNSVAGVYQATNFATEMFASSSLVIMSSKILYAALTLIFILYSTIGIWGIAWGAWISGLFVLLCSIRLSKAIMPSLNCSLTRCSLTIIKEVVVFVAWTLLVYCGIYLSGTGIQIVARNCITDDTQLARLVLSFQIGTIANSLLISLSIATSPGIHKALAKQAYLDATRLVERYFFLVTVAAVVGIMLFTLEGERLLKAWLGNYAPINIIPVATGVIVAFAIASLSVGLFAFLSSANHINSYGIITFIEGLCSTVLVSVWLLLAKWLLIDGLLYVGWILASVTAMKVMFTLFKFRNILSLMPLTAYLKEVTFILCLTVLSFGIYELQTCLLPQNFILMPVRMLLFCAPFVVFLVLRLFTNTAPSQIM